MSDWLKEQAERAERFLLSVPFKMLGPAGKLLVTEQKRGLSTDEAKETAPAQCD